MIDPSESDRDRAKEICAAVINGFGPGRPTDNDRAYFVACHLAAAREAERERCAEIARDCLRWRGVERPWPADLEHIIEKILSGEPA